MPKFLGWGSEAEDEHRPDFLPALPPSGPPIPLDARESIEHDRSRHDERLRILRERAVAAHARYKAAETGRKIAEVEVRLTTRELLSAVLEWHGGAPYRNFVREMQKAFAVSESTANNYLRAARVAERTGVLSQDQDARIESISKMAIVGRLANSRDADRRAYAGYLEGLIRRGEPLPSYGAMERSGDPNVLNFFLRGYRQEREPVPMLAACYAFLRVLALAGDAEARDSMSDLLSRIRDGGRIEFRFLGACQAMIQDDGTRMALLATLERDLRRADREAKRLGFDYASDTASPWEKSDLLDLKGLEVARRGLSEPIESKVGVLEDEPGKPVANEPDDDEFSSMDF